MSITSLKLASTLFAFTALFVYAAPVEDGGSSGFLPAPSGGLTENPPEYKPMSAFDYESLNLGLNQEFLELDLFNYGLKTFSSEEFAEAGLNATDIELIAFMAEQEVGHAIMVANILGDIAKPCTFDYPISNVKEFIDLCARVTRIGESGVFGFLNHLNSRSSAQLLTQSISTESRQEMIFRQFEGLFPVTVWFETGITQSMQWTLISPLFKTCPATNHPINWNIFPGLTVVNAPNATDISSASLAANVSSQLSHPGQKVEFTWEQPGQKAGYNESFITVTATHKPPKFAVWISQLNVTYTPLENVTGNSAFTYQPGGTVYPTGDPIVNGSMFVALTDTDLFVTPFNVSALDKHVVAGPVVYVAG